MNFGITTGMESHLLPTGALMAVLSRNQLLVGWFSSLLYGTPFEPHAER